MMTRTPAPIRVLLTSTLLGASVTLSACGVLGDSTLKTQQAAKLQIEEITSEYTMILSKIGVSNDSLSSASKLDKLIRQADSIDGGSEKQERTISTLVAAMSSTAGGLRAHAISAMQIEQAMAREQIAENATAAMIVAAGAQPRADADFSNTQALIEQMRSGIDSQHDSINNDLTAMQQPLAQMRQQRERTRQQLQQLQTDAAQLHQRANDAGPVDGYPLVEEAAGMRSRSIPVKTQMAEAELQLSNLEPDIERLENQRENYEILRAATERAEENTRLLHAAVVAAGKAGQQRASALMQELEARLEAFDKRQSSEIDPLFGQAVANLQKAQRGGRSDNAMIAANAAIVMGELNAMRADAAGANMHLFEALSETADLSGNAGTWADRAKSEAEQRTTAIDAARSAYESALSKLGQGRDNAVAREAVQNLLAALDGKSLISEDTAGFQMNTPARRPGGRGGPASAGGQVDGGAATPQALCAIMNKVMQNPQNAANVQAFINAFYVEDPMIRRQMQDPQATQMTIQMLSGALAQQGGTNGAELKVNSVSGNTGELGAGAGVDDGMSIPIIKLNGKWYFDADKLRARAQQMMQQQFQQGGFDLN